MQGKLHVLICSLCETARQQTREDLPQWQATNRWKGKSPS
jgi:hypothetical protein